MSLHPTCLAFVGGFLAAGKTTLILKAAELAESRGLRPAVIMNDQDAGLVDSQLTIAHGVQTREVSGGCFCCRFSDLIDAADQLLSYQPDIIFAEPVGSCIDLSATILQPLKVFHDRRFRLAPLTVLLDPALAQRIGRSEAALEVEYLFRNQLAEADLVCASKRDIYSALRNLPVPVEFHLSAKTGEGVANWLDEVLSCTRVVGARLLEVDYRSYAEAEAALGWLNLQAEVHLSEPASPSAFAGPLLDRLEAALSAQNIAIAHLKIFDRAASGWIAASIAGSQLPVPSGDLLADPSRNHEFAINLRAIADPDLLQSTVRSVLAGIPGHIQIRHVSAFRPAEPKPEYRFTYGHSKMMQRP